MTYFGDFRFDAHSGSLWREGLRVPLTGRAAAVLDCLIQGGGQPVTKQEILSAVWGDVHVAPENVKVLIRELRRALGDNVHAPRFIRTFPGSYTFIAPVSEAAPSIDSGPAVFVGRSAELETIARCFEEAMNGTRRTVLISGHSGMGKSALWERALRAASQRGFLLARAECMPASTPLEPYAPILEAIHSLLTDHPHLEDALSRHAPALIHYLKADVPVARMHPRAADAPARLLRESVAAFEALSTDAPVVLALENVHWLDDASADVLRALGLRHHSARVCVLATARPLEGHASEAATVFDELAAARAGVLVPLAALAHSDVEEYAIQRFGHAAGLAPLLEAASEGHPALLTAAADAIARRLVLTFPGDSARLPGAPPEMTRSVVNAVAGVLERRLRQLTREEHAILTSVSCLGLEFSTVNAARISGMEPATVETVLNELALRGDVIGRASLRAHGTFRFTNPMYLEILSRTAAIA